MSAASTLRTADGMPGSYSPAPQTNPVASSRCTRHKSSPHSASMSARRSTRRATYTLTLPNEGLIHGALCDACDIRIMGTRFKCRQCPDFDFCSSCVMHHKDIHYPDHTFKAIHFPKDHLAPEPANRFSTSLVCDGCDSRIVGPSYKCLQCPDYDLCQLCEHYVDGLHNGNHIFAKLRKRCKPVGTRAPLLPIDLYDNSVARTIRGAPCEGCEIANQIRCKLHAHEQPPPYKEVEKPADDRVACANCSGLMTSHVAEASTSSPAVDLLTGSDEVAEQAPANVSEPQSEQPETPASQSVETQTGAQKEEATKEMVDVGVQPDEARQVVQSDDATASPAAKSNEADPVKSAESTEVEPCKRGDPKVDAVEALARDVEENLVIAGPATSEAAREVISSTENVVEVAKDLPKEVQADVSKNIDEIPEDLVQDADSSEELRGVVCTESELEDDASDSEAAKGTPSGETEDDGFEIVDMDLL